MSALVLTQGVRFWEGTTTLDGREIALHTDLPTTRVSEPLARATVERRCALAVAKLPEACTAAAARFLASYNDVWRVTGPPLDARAFARRLVLGRLRIYEDSLVTLFLSAPDLFAGHSIAVMFEEDGRMLGKPNLEG